MNLQSMIKQMWCRRSPYGALTAALKEMTAEGRMPPPKGLTPDQEQLYHRTHTCMIAASQELRRTVDVILRNDDTWRMLLRGGVCWRLLGTNVDDLDHIRIISAMRGERRPWKGQVQRTHEQLATPAGHAEATLDVLAAWSVAHPAEYAAHDLDRYRAVLVRVLPTLRRTVKASQAPRKANCEVGCVC